MGVKGMEMIACEDSFTAMHGGKMYGVGTVMGGRRLGIMISKYGISRSSRGRPSGMRGWSFPRGWNNTRMPYRKPAMPGMELDCANVAAEIGAQYNFEKGDLSNVDTSHMGNDARGMRRRLAEEGTHRRLAGMQICSSNSSSTTGHRVNATADGNWYAADEAYIGYSLYRADQIGRRQGGTRRQTLWYPRTSTLSLKRLPRTAGMP